MDSIVQKEKECFLCRQELGPEAWLPSDLQWGFPLERHHMICGSRRKKSEEHGLTCYLCQVHHNYVHSSKGSAKLKELKEIAKQAFIEKYSEEEFIKEFMK